MAKTDYTKLEKELNFTKRNCWEVWNEAEIKKALAFSNDYKVFLNEAKTERQAVFYGIKKAEEAGFKNIANLKKIKAGDKVYFANKDKSLVFAVLGEDLARDGFRLVMSHIDVPHLDLKVNPLYEEESLAFLKTHYYGGIKKYHWPTIALALHGVVVLASGKKVEITIGEKTDEPIFMITDLLPHLAKNQMKRTLDEAVTGEELNALIASIPLQDKKIKQKVRLAVLEYLYKKYGIKAEDLTSADLQFVPAGSARDLGLDKSMVAAYGQDDRICAYVSLQSFLAAKNKITNICLWIDREEIGSEGSTGAQSVFIENFIADLLEKSGQVSGIRQVYQVFDKSKAISADVTVALDPDYIAVHDMRNVAKMGCGVVIEKYTGYRGKYASSEASAEYTAWLRNILNSNKNIWQTGGLGKIDEGGGGTIAMYLANRNMEVIDMGVAILNMHAPLEISSKADIYSAYLAYLTFYKN